MAYESRNVEDSIINGGGFGFGGGGVVAVIAVLLIAFILFDRKGIDGGHGGYPAYGAGGCGVCVKPTYVDESNWEEESHLKDKICETDKDVWKTSCKTQEKIMCEEEKTRGLINHLQERADDKAFAQMNMQLAQKDNQIQTLQLFGDFNSKIACLTNNMDKMFCKTDSMIAALACELPKRPQVYAECVTPNTHHVDCDDRKGYGYGNMPQRKGCCNDGIDGGYGYAY